MTDTLTPATTATTAWLRLGRAAAITMVVWSVLLQAVFARELIPPVLIVGLVFLGFSFFLAGERRRLGLAYAVVTVVLVAGNLPQIVSSLSAPASAPSFVLTLASVLAPAAAVVAGLGAFFRWPVPAIRPTAIAVVAVFAVGAAASIAIAVTTESDVALVGDAQVTAERVAFAPEAITLASDATGVWVDNRDGVHHTFTVEALGIDLEIPALKAKRVDVAAAAGTYEVICTVPGHDNMTATLIVSG